MGFADDMLTEEEQEYFKSRGASEGNDSQSSEPEAREDLQDDQSESGNEGASRGSDGADPSGDEEEANSRDEEDPSVQESDRPEDDENSSERDFKKAYGIAENKRKQLRDQLNQQNEYNLALQRQIDELTQRFSSINQPTQESEKIPDKEEDPIAYYQYQLENLNKIVEQQQNYLRQEAEARQQSQQLNGVISEYKKKAVEFSQEKPDFKEAYAFLEKSRLNELQAVGYTPQEAAALLQEDELAIVLRSMRDGDNPAERIYAAAKARGYNSLASAPSKLENIKKGLDNSKSLSSTKAKNIKRSLDYDSIDNMTDEEFDRFFEQVKREHIADNNYRKGI